MADFIAQGPGAQLVSSMAPSSAARHCGLFCEIIATQMPGMRHLKIKLYSARERNLPLGPEAEWIQAMLGIRSLHTFRLEIEIHVDGYPLSVDYCDKLRWLKPFLEEKLVPHGKKWELFHVSHQSWW